MFGIGRYEEVKSSIFWVQQREKWERRMKGCVMGAYHHIAQNDSKNTEVTNDDCCDLESESWVDATRLDREHMTTTLPEEEEPSLDSTVFPSYPTASYQAHKQQTIQSPVLVSSVVDFVDSNTWHYHRQRENITITVYATTGAGAATNTTIDWLIDWAWFNVCTNTI